MDRYIKVSLINFEQGISHFKALIVDVTQVVSTISSLKFGLKN